MDKITEGIILVGGLGTRMGISTPKSLLMKKGKTVLEYIADNFRKNGIDDITLMTGDLDESPKKERHEFDKLGYKLVDGLDKYNPKGDYIVSVGDIIVNFDLEKMYEHHKSLSQAGVTILTTDFEIPYGTIENGFWTEKPKKEIAAGVFIVKNRIRSNSIQNLVKNCFTTFKTQNDFIHLTTMEDYQKWTNKD